VHLASTGEGLTESSSGPSIERPESDSAFAPGFISDQTRTLLRWVMAFGMILGGWSIWQDIFPAFSFVNKVELWTYTVEAPASEAPTSETAPPGAAGSAQPARVVKAVYLADLLFALILAGFTVILATNGPNVIEMVLLTRLPIDAGARFAIAALSRYLIIVTGLILSFQSLGIGWNKVQWLAAAITVGLGFGLQEIFANFVSGLIILFERPVRIGDVVTVGGVDGKITRIQMRATTLTDWNRRELIVPNKDLITGRIVNWTLSDPVTRVDIAVGIAYGSDTQLARNLLLEVAKASPHVLATPGPVAIFRSFGESSLDFELRVHIPNRDIWPQMIDDLHTRIDNAFREAGIEIAFPQRDIHVRSVVDGLPVTRNDKRVAPGTPGAAIEEAGTYPVECPENG
jgi:potassium efflux system protein